MLLVVDGSVDVAEYDGVFARVGCGRPIEQQESLVDICAGGFVNSATLRS